MRLEIYCAGEAEARGLAKRFGGRVRAVPAGSWQPPPATAPGHALGIGGRLWVTGREEELPALRAAHPGKAALCIPAAMAFGTGEHATTAMCLRLLAETARTLKADGHGGAWELLDLGSGSGILALAGKMFGARSALGLDNDPHAVRIARENAALNGVRGGPVPARGSVEGLEPGMREVAGHHGEPVQRFADGAPATGPPRAGGRRVRHRLRHPRHASARSGSRVAR